MPRFDTSAALENFNGSNNYGFSGTRIENLGSTEYTLVTIAVDLSGSTSGFHGEIVACFKEVLSSLRQSPRADFLMLRVIKFGSRVEEVHGFKPLQDCNADDYDAGLSRDVGASTALFDATVNAAESVAVYGKTLVDQDFDANGILYVITDGMDNNSAAGSNTAKDAVDQTVNGENVESCLSVLIGVNVDPGSGTSAYLDQVRQDVGFDMYEPLGATADDFAKLAGFIVSQSVSQSQSLGTGGPSQVLTF